MVENDNISSSPAYSPNLFKNEQDRPLEFYVHPSVDSEHLIKLIKNGGGEVVCVDHPRAIHVMSRKGFLNNTMSVSASFIYASCLENKLLDLHSFRLQPEQSSASAVFISLLDGIEKVIKTTSKERIKNIIKHLSLNDTLWKNIADNKEFEGCSAIDIRNTFNIWAFLTLKMEESKHEKILRDLRTVVKNVAEEYCGCGNKFKRFERNLTAAKLKRKSPGLPEEEATKEKINRCDEEGEQVPRKHQNSLETANMPSSDISANEDHQERVPSKDEDCNGDMEICDEVYNVNGVETEACASCSSLGAVDHVINEEMAERCTEEGTGEENVKDSNGAKVNGSDGNLAKEKNSVDETVKNKKVEEMVGCVKSGVWLEKSAMKKLKLQRMENEEPVVNDERSSSESDSEVKILARCPVNKLYTLDEDLVIIKWVLKTRRCPWKVQGNRIWEYFEKKKILPNRSWQSMKERFKRRICTNLDKFGLSEVDIKRLKKLL